MKCRCQNDNFQGTYCQDEVTRSKIDGINSPAAVVVPVFLIIIVILTAAGLYIYWKRKQGM